MADKFDSFSDLLRAALGDRLAPADSLLGLFTDDVIFEFPYAPDGLPKRLDGKAALAAHLEKLGPLLIFGPMELGSVHAAGDTVVFEFSCSGTGVNTGAPYNQKYISVVTVREGRIAHYRDYWNPLVVLTALGGTEAAAAAYEGTA
ncbi:putative PhzA/B-like protein [Roseovarius sp. EC-HK134]|uniref:nuclear transport factor 2 family protein n=1 Tax=unclassified Roseovarius TaxID=2614913 RepID=UPI00125AC992|nr:MULTISPECIES: nuclear transport factor 2 family protein [unclassified Roseovarius]VVT21328.1 putative PhzA/B-like protein [Roseovarius sp. EC-SD190]VVT21445.1 putative PhzA/B-like protein [Roseovarius sp. EC-HK134]